MVKIISILTLYSFLLISCDESITTPVPEISQNSHIEFGIPNDSNPSDDYIIKRHQYVLSYNSERGSPNWVSYNLEISWYGDSPRYQGNFKADPLIPLGLKIVKHDDYTNTGYDRGHLVRSEERTNSDTNNIATFYMTNVIPMTPDLNRGPWLDLEFFCEDKCKKEDCELYIIAGGIYKSNSWINNKVAIPDSCFKIIVIMKKNQGLQDVTNSTIVRSYIMPNKSDIRNEDYSLWLTTIDKIELSTGYDFLNLIPDNIESIIEAKKIS